jgi:hypothetical protein
MQIFDLEGVSRQVSYKNGGVKSTCNGVIDC